MSTSFSSITKFKKTNSNSSIHRTKNVDKIDKSKSSKETNSSSAMKLSMTTMDVPSYTIADSRTSDVSKERVELEAKKKVLEASISLFKNFPSCIKISGKNKDDLKKELDDVNQKLESMQELNDTGKKKLSLELVKKALEEKRDTLKNMSVLPFIKINGDSIEDLDKKIADIDKQIKDLG